MAKDSPLEEERRKEKKVKKEKKEKRSEKDGVHKSKKEKKDKEKEKKKPAAAPDILEPLSANLDTEMTGVATLNDAEDVKTIIKPIVPIGALVPFANPLADEKVAKKLLKGVKKCKANPSSSITDR